MGDGSPLNRRLREIRRGNVSVPFEFDELEKAAAETLPASVFEYASTGAGDKRTVRANRDGFNRWRIVPRTFRDISERELGVELFGEALPAPFLLSPIGGQTAFHEEGELASARAAASLNIPFTLSTVASRSLEDVAQEAGELTRLFQLYWTSDWDITADLLERAEDAGYTAILVTVDFQLPRWTPQTAANADDQAPRSTRGNLPPGAFSGTEKDFAEGKLQRDNSVSWEDFGFLRNHTDLPIFVKGIMHPEDARLAVKHDADGIVVSNHGGRQLGGGIGAVTALPRIVEATDGRLPVLFDSGIRSGADAFKALALGADAVFLGRPYVYGLAIEGERGVYEVIHNLLAEFESVVGLAGYDSVSDVDRTALLDSRPHR